MGNKIKEKECCHIWGQIWVKPIYIGTGNCLCYRTCKLCGIEQRGFREHSGEEIQWEKITHKANTK